MGFIGSHFDVVLANPESWEHDPFKLTTEGEKMYGQGPTDCLGHVATGTKIGCSWQKEAIAEAKNSSCVYCSVS